MSATTAPGPARDLAVSRSLGRRRHIANSVVKVLCVVATVIGLALLASILFTLLYRGVGGLSLSVFTTSTLPPGSHGGLLNAIIGSLIQTLLGAAIGTPVGLMVGTYLAEYSQGSVIGDAVRFVSDVLLSAPSILVGLFVYEIAVYPFGGFSGIAGCLALAVIVIPIVVRTDRGYAATDPFDAARGGDCPGRAEVEDDRFGVLSSGKAGDRDGYIARGGPHRRRDRAAAVHQPGQPQLVTRAGQANGQSPGNHLSIRGFGVPGLGATRLGRRIADYVWRSGHQHRGAPGASPRKLRQTWT